MRSSAVLGALPLGGTGVGDEASLPDDEPEDDDDELQAATPIERRARRSVRRTTARAYHRATLAAMRTDLDLRVLATAAVLSSAGFVFAGGCGSSDSTDSTAEAGADSSVPEAAPEDDAGDDAAATFEQCVATCNTTHAAGKAAQDAVDSCWQMHCSEVCISDAGTFMPPDSGPDAAPLTCGLPGEPVDTGNPMCDTCTTDWCCTPYEACEMQIDCAAYGKCLDQCEMLENQ